MIKAQSFEELVELYGRPWAGQRGRLDFEERFMTLWRASILEDRLGLELGTIPIRRVYCNRDMIHALDLALFLLNERDLLSELKTFDGCWNIRPIRGRDDKWSVHSFGLAIDLNAAENPMGGEVTFSAPFITAMKEAGFTWGGDFKRVDGMHFQFADNC